MIIKRKYFIVLQIIIGIILLQGCMEKTIKTINCEYARKNNYPITFSVDKKQYTGNIIKIVDLNPNDKQSSKEITYKQNKIDKTATGFDVRLLFPVYPQDKNIDYFVIIKNQLLTIKGISKTSEDSVLKLKSIDEYELTSIDDSKIKGYVTALDINTGAIT
jgi:hypothetical protein